MGETSLRKGNYAFVPIIYTFCQMGSCLEFPKLNRGRGKGNDFWCIRSRIKDMSFSGVSLLHVQLLYQEEFGSGQNSFPL